MGCLSVGGVIAVAHIGVLGHLIKKEPPVQSAPTINLPRESLYSYTRLKQVRMDMRLNIKVMILKY